jgi:hypothetical protein
MARSQPATVVANTTGEFAALDSVGSSASAQTAIVLAETTSEGAALASAIFGGVGSASHCGEVHIS